MGIPSRVRERIVGSLKRLSPILEQQRIRDVSEADTVTLVKDLLSETFGYDKYADLTSEYAIRGTYCDLAVKIENKLTLLVEVKAIGVELEDRHVKQAVDYASNQGIEWVILTNAITWRLFHVIFSKPIDKRQIAELDICSLDLKKESCIEMVYLFTKEGVRKGVHVDLRDRQEATSRYLLSALLLENDAVLGIIRRELRRVVDVPVSQDEIATVLRNEVIKRDILDGANAEKAMKRVCRKERATRTQKAPDTVEPSPISEPVTPPASAGIAESVITQTAGKPQC